MRLSRFSKRTARARCSPGNRLPASLTPMLQSLSSAKAAVLGLAAASVAAGVLTGGAQSAPLKELSSRALARIDGDVKVQGLESDVRIVRDTWGVPHIYANSDDDLFFAQGYVMAQDRLWQMEMWRRTAEGRAGRVLGPQAVGRDRMARLLKYRGPFDAEELRAITRDAKRLMTAFAAGVNAFIASTRRTPACRVRADRHQTGAVDRRDAAAAAGDVRRRDERTAARAAGRLAGRRRPRTAGAIPIRGTSSPCRTVSTWRASVTTCWRPRAAAAGACRGRRSCRATADCSPAAARHDAHAPWSRIASGSRAATTGSSAARCPPPASLSSPTIRTARSPIRRCATSSISTRRAGT